MSGEARLAECGLRLAYCFVPSGKRDLSRAEWLFDQLDRVDFGSPDCRPQDLLVGRPDQPRNDAGPGAIADLASGVRSFTADDADAYIVTIDRHGTPSYLVARNCPLPAHIIEMDVLEFEPIHAVTKAMACSPG